MYFCKVMISTTTNDLEIFTPSEEGEFLPLSEECDTQKQFRRDGTSTLVCNYSEILFADGTNHLVANSSGELNYITNTDGLETDVDCLSDKKIVTLNNRGEGNSANSLFDQNAYF